MFLGGGAFAYERGIPQGCDSQASHSGSCSHPGCFTLQGYLALKKQPIPLQGYLALKKQPIPLQGYLAHKKTPTPLGPP
jgi:hypothetical protein